jgi:hypothetical protein
MALLFQIETTYQLPSGLATPLHDKRIFSHYETYISTGYAVNDYLRRRPSSKDSPIVVSG